MALTREERKLLHQKSQQPTFGSGKPDSREGSDGDISFRKVEGSGTVQYLKEGNDWTAISSTGEMPAIRIAGGVGGGGSSGVSNHASLSGLESDDHDIYLLIDGTRAMTGDLSLGGGDGALTFTVAGENSIKIPDNQASALIIEEANAAYLTFVTTNSSEKITLGKKLEAGSVEIEGTAFDINGGSIDGTAIGAASHSTIKGTTIDATTDFTIDGLVITADTISNDADLTIDGAADIILSADGDQIKMDDGSTTRFVFNVDSTPEIDVTGAFTIDGSSTITLDAVSNFVAKTNGREVLKFDTNSHAYFHAYGQTLFNDYYINISATNRHLTSGSDDFQQNYSWLGKHSVSSVDTFNADFGT